MGKYYRTWSNGSEIADLNPFRYAGYVYDKETKKYYLSARYYDPESGRFLSEDSFKGDAGDPLSLNYYAYAKNNPVMNSDASGHFFDTLLDIVSIGYSTYQLIRHPSWENAGYLAWDVGAAFVPFIPGSYVAKGAKFSTKAASKLKKGKADGRVIKAINACNCFMAGTKVLTDKGEKSIEEIKVGDKVLARDDETGETAYKEVEWLFQRDVEETYNITVGSEVITTTDEHPFWIVGKGWVEANQLVVGDVLTTADGKDFAIERVEVKNEHTTVYNFMVKDFHTYFVSNLGIWTHNSVFLILAGLPVAYIKS